MDAVEFLEEAHRMCDSFDDCEDCPGVAACRGNDTEWQKTLRALWLRWKSLLRRIPKLRGRRSVCWHIRMLYWITMVFYASCLA